MGFPPPTAMPPGTPVSKPSRGRMSIRTGAKFHMPDSSAKGLLGCPDPRRGRRRAQFRLNSRQNSAMRELDHGLAGGDLLVVLVANDDIDHHPAGIRRGLFRFHGSRRLDG